MYYIKDLRIKDIIYIDELTIPYNKITCILGESGSGKTTLLRALNKLIDYDEGDILFDDKSLKDWDSVQLRRRVIMLSQEPGIFKGDIRDNLLIGLKFAEKPMVNDSTLIKILKQIGLDKDLDFDADRLSGGERQRLALARIMLLEPEVLLLDEPSSALDEKTAERIIMMIRDYIQERKGTLIMVTHSKALANRYGENIISLSKRGELFK